MAYKDKKLHPLRLYPDEYAKIMLKAKEDGITFQKLGEIFFKAYMKDHKPTRRLVEKYIETHATKKSKSPYNEMEADEILRLIEKEYSPLTDLEKAQQEIDDK